MRVILPVLAVLLTTAPASAREVAPLHNPALLPTPIVGQTSPDTVCRDRIQEVRRELGKPALQRDPAPEDGLLIAAVDKRVGGCSVLVMRNDTSDIRPLPEAGEHRLMPAK
jgi:hypothetical protein